MQFLVYQPDFDCDEMDALFFIPGGCLSGLTADLGGILASVGVAGVFVKCGIAGTASLFPKSMLRVYRDGWVCVHTHRAWWCKKQWMKHDENCIVRSEELLSRCGLSQS